MSNATTPASIDSTDASAEDRVRAFMHRYRLSELLAEQRDRFACDGIVLSGAR